jgi:3-hydroxybutyryl-CoA dehydrogenase
MKNLVIGIVGMGMIGNTTAVLSTLHGIKTIAYVRNPHKTDERLAEFDHFYQQMIDQQVITAAQAQYARTYLRIVHNYEDLAPCTFIFEAIRETPEDKWDCFRELERCCPNVRAIGSCSSSILADVLSEATPELADRILVTHPFFPAHMVPYMELCRGEHTSDEAVAYTLEVLEALDRKPSTLKKPNPGFIGNYLQFALWAAALKLVDDGVCKPEDIDNCLAYSFCPRYTSIGMFEHFDNGGYRLNATTCDSVFPALPRYDGAPDIVREKAESSDAWGAKSPSKRGFYDWSDVDMDAYGKRVNAPYWRFIDWEFPESDCAW